ncbi:M20 family metallopeptidase [Alicyclobacillus macrosporangiidus]|uniref:M20 family metallopeptidase n=1 Tax=Alicyclobacillus macrosporangiidus TaxID=392015 RepID=UPI0004969C42|nr:M20 family metallopeptidase [Alicyclobacillus macrosporangiidus]
MTLSDFYAYLEAHRADILQDIRTLVEAESPTHRKDLVDECGQVLAGLFRDRLGLAPEVLAQDKFGDHLRFTYGEGESQVLIIGHFDTVWDPGRLALREEGDRLFGPGVLDMKAGLVQALWAVRALQAGGGSLPHKVVFLCNSDEEVGSRSSRPVIEAEARKSKAVFVVEPAQAETGALKTGRKGVSMYRVHVRGRAAHAGNHHEAGVSAIRELARIVQYLEGLTDYELGTTVNVGVIRGGTRSNVVPESAEAEVDVRTVTVAEAERIDAVIKGLGPSREGLRVEVEGGINRPPMERTEKTARLFALAQEIGSQLGMSLGEALVGGGSDGNFTAAIGVPTLDGLGAVGDGPHAEYEHILISHVVPRAALLAHLLTRV